jgi:hypothetical protein
MLMLIGSISAEMIEEQGPLDFHILSSEPVLDFHVLSTNEEPALDFHLIAADTPQKECRCTEGEACICGESCTCPECPCKKTNKPVVWAGKPNKQGRWAKLVCSEDCGPCQKEKKDLTPLAAHIAILNFPSIEKAGEAGHNALPYAYLYEGKDCVTRLHPTACKSERIQEWLSGKAEYHTPLVSNRAPNRQVSVSRAPRGRSMTTCSGGVCRTVWVPY